MKSKFMEERKIEDYELEKPDKKNEDPALKKAAQ